MTVPLKKIQQNPLKLIVLVLICLNLAACAGDDFSDLEEKIAEIKARPKGKIPDLPTIKKPEVFTYDLDGSRDPFRPVVKEPDPTDEAAKAASLIKPDKNRVKEELEGFGLDTLRMVGTLKKDAILWALVQSNNKTVYRVTIGNYMGLYDGKITEISHNEIKLMEIVPDKEPNTWREQPNSLKLVETPTK